MDFITLDNSSPDEFDLAQWTWLSGVLQRAGDNPNVRTIVLGMHAALPDSFSAGHSMNDSAQQEYTGRNVLRVAGGVSQRKPTRTSTYWPAIRTLS